MCRSSVSCNHELRQRLCSGTGTGRTLLTSVSLYVARVLTDCLLFEFGNLEFGLSTLKHKYQNRTGSLMTHLEMQQRIKNGPAWAFQFFPVTSAIQTCFCGHLAGWVASHTGMGTVYPAGRPQCPWHGKTNCVDLEGWVSIPRHCYDEDSITTLLGKKYKCSEREKTS
jgi:hypothetical protein